MHDVRLLQADSEPKLLACVSKAVAYSLEGILDVGLYGSIIDEEHLPDEHRPYLDRRAYPRQIDKLSQTWCADKCRQLTS